MRRLRFGDWSVEVDAQLLTLAGERCTLAPFLSSAESASRLVLRAEPVPEGQGAPLDPRYPQGTRFQVDGDVVRVEPPKGELDTELALRVGMQLATLRQGGLLLHAGGVAFGERGVVAIGPSGAGKSTFTRLCTQAAGAQVLSDEVLALYPEGRVEGSPFCSDLDLPSTRARAPLTAVLLLHKGTEERLEEVSPREALTVMLGQVFRPLPGEGSPREVLRRLAHIVEQTTVRRFVFRKDEAAAGFVRDWLDGRQIAR
ncbi:potassium transporter TrkH [Hyalangium rubrum]|uniref:Potassium transporter TrkH n=1 Tax=Hyalangium rubrum TaxID=3103134 RepID=A0ABU5HFA5_9BACT|nr:potassium transporter TrkH [Hyalangium sp. s54d21]MDY7231931.1 potassium transporter TrkH [Hyalangium sp. s54d21]